VTPDREAEPRSLVVTGANGHLGLGLLRHAARRGRARAFRAVVRSERAAATIRAEPAAREVEIRVVDTADEEALCEAVRGTRGWVHLVGILKETRSARYEETHERSAARVARAAEKAGVSRVVYLSILGAHPDAPNACLASKGRAERSLLAGSIAATVLRVPMVLGPGELAATALRTQALAPATFLVRGGVSLEQPIDAEDVAQAILGALADPARDSVALDLAGPESLPHRELVTRVGFRLGRRPRIVAVPLPAARLLAALLGRLPDPPLTPAMLGVLEHDDCIDPQPACERLGLVLTPLDETLDRTFGPPPPGAPS
jgi:uncharacterized protein YbjT (DUF2867 family)